MVFVSEGIGIASILGMIRCWSSHHERVPAVLLHEDPGHDFELLHSEAEKIGSATGNLTIRTNETLRSLRAATHRNSLVFVAGSGRFVGQMQDECIGLGLDHTRVRIKRVAS